MTQNKPLCPLAWAIPPSPLMLKCGNDYYTCSKCGEKVDKPEPQIFSRVTSYDDTKPQSVGVEVTDGIHLCKGCNTMKHVDADGFCGRCRPVGVEGEIDLKLFRAIANANHYGSKRTRGEANEDMHYEEMQPKSQMLVARIKDIYRPIITSLLAQEREKSWNEAYDMGYKSGLYDQDSEKVDRFEVIDDTGRVYVKGSIYSTPVKVELSYQDDGRTLKVFVSDRLAALKEGMDRQPLQ